MRKSKVDWHHHLRAQEASGLSINQYCGENGIKPATFHCNKRKSALKTISPSRGFAEVIVCPELLLSLDPDGTVTISRIQPELIPAILRVCSHALSQ